MNQKIERIKSNNENIQEEKKKNQLSHVNSLRGKRPDTELFLVRISLYSN